MRLLWVITVVGLWQMSTFAAPIIIDYTNALTAANLPQAEMDRVGQLRWFFAHASVGENMMEGLTRLHASAPGYYQLTRTSVSDTPPANTQPGVIYDYNRGNPAWAVKVDSFKTYVTNGWRMPKVDVILNKFCWIDNAADVNYYLTNSAALERANPQTTFVYLTIPLDTSPSADNCTRNLFNDTIRAWVRAHNRILYDIADMEAHDTNGVLQTFSYTNSVWHKLFDGYTYDGGHLETEAAQELVALGFYALGAALVNADRDGDGMPDWWENANGFDPFDPADEKEDRDGDASSNAKEFLSGTDPNNAQSVLRTICGLTQGVFYMSFTAASNVAYVIQVSTNLASSWMDQTPIDPAPFDRSFTLVDQTPAAKAWYRVRARRVP